MIGNLVPFFNPPTYGCFYWSWVIDVDLQLALAVPFLVVLYLKAPFAANVVCVLIVLAGIAINMWITSIWDLKAGLLATQNWYMFAYMLEKPWNHLPAMSLGVMFSYLYCLLLDYRACTDVIKEQEYPWIHFCHTQEWTRSFMKLIGTVLLVGSLLWIYPTLDYAYDFSLWENMVYYGLTRFFVPLGMFLCIFAFLFFEPGTFMKEFLRRPANRAMGQCCFMASLIAPVVIHWQLASTPDGNYLTIFIIVY